MFASGSFIEKLGYAFSTSSQTNTEHRERSMAEYTCMSQHNLTSAHKSQARSRTGSSCYCTREYRASHPRPSSAGEGLLTFINTTPMMATPQPLHINPQIQLHYALAIATILPPQPPNHPHGLVPPRSSRTTQASWQSPRAGSIDRLDPEYSWTGSPDHPEHLVHREPVLPCPVSSVVRRV